MKKVYELSADCVLNDVQISTFEMVRHGYEKAYAWYQQEWEMAWVDRFYPRGNLWESSFDFLTAEYSKKTELPKGVSLNISRYACIAAYRESLRVRKWGIEQSRIYKPFLQYPGPVMWLASNAGYKLNLKNQTITLPELGEVAFSNLAHLKGKISRIGIGRTGIAEFCLDIQYHPMEDIGDNLLNQLQESVNINRGRHRVFSNIREIKV